MVYENNYYDVQPIYNGDKSDDYTVREQEHNLLNDIQNVSDRKKYVKYQEPHKKEFYRSPPKTNHYGITSYDLENKNIKLSDNILSYQDSMGNYISNKFSEYCGLSFDEFMKKFENNNLLSSNSSIRVDYNHELCSVIFLINCIPFVSFPIYPKLFITDLHIFPNYTGRGKSDFFHLCPNVSYEKCVWEKIQKFTNPATCPMPDKNGFIKIDSCPHIHENDIHTSVVFDFSVNDYDDIIISFSNSLPDDNTHGKYVKYEPQYYDYLLYFVFFKSIHNNCFTYPRVINFPDIDKEYPDKRKFFYAKEIVMVSLGNFNN